MDVREELIRLYTTYNPKRLKDVDALLERFKGREHVILKSLRETYEQRGSVHTPASTTSTALNSSAHTSNFASFLFPNTSTSVLESDARDEERGRANAIRDTQRVRTSGGSGAASTQYLPVTQFASVLSATPHNAAESAGAVQPSSSWRHNAASAASTLVGRDDSRATNVRGGVVSSSSAGASLSATAAFVEPGEATTSPFLALATGASTGVSCSSAVPVTSAARQAEMRELIRHMTSLDVGQLARRVEELSLASAEESRVPRLLWRHEEKSSASATGVGGASVAFGSDGAAHQDVGAVLQHTSVFLRFFAECARRYVDLASAEQQHWEGRLSGSPHGESPAKPSPSSPLGVAREQTSVISPPSASPHVNTAVHDASPLKDYARSNSDSNEELISSPPPRSTTARKDNLNSSPPHPQRSSSGSGEHHTAAVASQESSAAAPPQQTRRTASSCVRGIRRAHDASPLSVDDRGSPPTCRTTTVSPLTSPVSSRNTPERQRVLKSRTASPITEHRVREGRGSPPQRRDGVRGKTRSPDSSLGGNDRSSEEGRPRVDSRASPLLSPAPLPPLLPPTPQMSEQLLRVSAPGASLTSSASAKTTKRVINWAPVAGQPNRYGPSCAALTSGDCVVLQPGVYYENLVFENCGQVELTSAYPGAAVVLRPASDLEPVIAVSGANCHVRLTGIVLVQGDLTNSDSRGDRSAMQASATSSHDPLSPAHETSYSSGGGGGFGNEEWRAASRVRLAQPTVPLLSVRDGADVAATACHFYGGTGGGVVASGRDTRLRLDLCLISLCHFAGVYVHGGASADITQSKVKKSEVGLRVLRGSFFVGETTVEECASDGVVVYEESMGAVERSNVFNNGGNGVFLSSGAELRVVASTIELNALYGVQRARGSTLHIKSSFVRDNGLLPINEELE